jgi:hypothetical protein
MDEKSYKNHLQELFGPNPTTIWIKYHNMWADEINHKMAVCRSKYNRPLDDLSNAEANICYWYAVLDATPKFIQNLKNAVNSECKGNNKCMNGLTALVNKYQSSLPEVKNEIQRLKRQIELEKRTDMPAYRKKAGKKLKMSKK